MSVVFVPVLRTAVSYSVSFGRRWSILEHMLLKALASDRRTVADLARSANLPDRLVIEALINLLRANWIEVRASDEGAFFAVTSVGKKRSSDQTLPAHVERGEKWTSLCFDRITGTWLRADDLAIVYERDLPNAARIVPSVYSTYSPADGDLRDLLYLSPQESLEPDAPRLRTPSRPYARFEVLPDRIEGLPDYAPLKLRQAILDAAEETSESRDAATLVQTRESASGFRGTITAQDVFVGGAAHRALIGECFEAARSTVIIHSCFVNPKTIKAILPELEAAAARKIRVELLWGLVRDPELDGQPPSIREAEQMLNSLSPAARRYVCMSTTTSGSHAKLILYDDAATGRWTTAISSCNLLSTNFDALDVAVRVRSPGLAAKLLSWLTTTQQPSAGGWPHLARRLNALWGQARVDARDAIEEGEHSLSLLVDADHYACIRRARDHAESNIVVACDLYGLSAETSVLVPMEVAANKGIDVKLLYCRPSKLLREEDRTPKAEDLASRKLALTQVRDLHGKFLLWDDESLAVTSFNWLSTAVDGTRTRGAEFGVLIEGPALRSLLVEAAQTAPEARVLLEILATATQGEAISGNGEI
jgi:hypothetical protein